MLILYTPIVILFGIVVGIRLGTGIAIAEFTRDPLGFTGIPVYTGSISNLGVLIWTASAAICFFTYGIRRSAFRDNTTSTFLLTGGLVTTMLMLDDLFMLHEVVFPEELGIPEELVYLTYLLVVVGFLVRFRSLILQTNFLLLALACVGFGVSIGADEIARSVSIPGMYLFEDGGKFFGIVNWAAYFIQVSARHIRAGERGSQRRPSVPETGASVPAGASDRSHTPSGTA